MTIRRRKLLQLAGVASAAAALEGALRMEGGAMAATPTAATLPFALTTPLHVGEAALKVRDLEKMNTWYRAVLGFSEISRKDATITLGAGGVPLLHLVHHPDAGLEAPTAAGLFHIAWLMPQRADLARWLVHIAMMQVPVTGFADHNVSEAVYLNDPEGNGIEVYSDRPKENWSWDGDMVTMGTQQLDIDDIVALTDTTKDNYSGAPDGLRIGHMHLRIGEIASGRAFYEKAVGLDSTRGNRPDAAFLSSGRYHHHVAMNIWNSEGAKPRNSRDTGLEWFSLVATDAGIVTAQKERLTAGGYAFSTITNGVEAADPWGTKLRLVTA